MGLLPSFVSAQGELSRLFVGERFNLYNGAVHQVLWSIPDFLIANRDQFEIGPRELNSVYRSKFEMLPSTFLLHEESSWAVAVYKEVLVDEKNDSALFLGEGVKLYDYLRKIKSSPKFEFYGDPYFSQPLFASEIFKRDTVLIRKILIKENYAYSKVTKKLEKRIISVGIEYLDQGRNERVWMYYPKIKGQLKYAFPDARFIYCLEDERYDISHLEMAPIPYQGESRSHLYFMHQLIQIDLLQQSLRAQTKVQKKQVKLWDGMLYKGNYNDGYQDGIHCIYQGKRKILEFEVRKGLIQGVARSLIDDYEFAFEYAAGSLSGKGQIRYSDGKLYQALNFSEGYLEGYQRILHPNGQLAIGFNVEASSLDGAFEFYRETGELLYKGSMKGGLKEGLWTYRLNEQPYLAVIVGRNTAFFDAHFSSKADWKSADLFQTGFDFQAEYQFYADSSCLNQRCLNLDLK